VLPSFFEQLREQVYPLYASVAGARQDYWIPGWNFETWRLHSDPDGVLTRRLLAWARTFRAEKSWILEGALQTLWHWHDNASLRESLDISGFRSSPCGQALTSDEERLFRFADSGWDPEYQTWATYRAYIQQQFKQKLTENETRLRSLVEARGAVRAHYGYSVDNFEWFALHTLGKMSATKILNQRTDLQGDESTIRKGVKAAAALIQW